MNSKNFEKYSKEFAKQFNYVVEELTAFKEARNLYMRMDDGVIMCMIKFYKNEMHYHPHVGICPAESACHATILTQMNVPFRIGDIFYYDELMQDCYYGENALDAMHLELKHKGFIT